MQVEWVHGIAPGAKIVLVEANDSDPTNYFKNAAAVWARDQSGAQVIMMGYYSPEYSTEAGNDASIFQSSAANGITWLAPSGDSGTSGSYYPAEFAQRHSRWRH